jgi:hypothetical protein
MTGVFKMKFKHKYNEKDERASNGALLKPILVATFLKMEFVSLLGAQIQK